MRLLRKTTTQRWLFIVAWGQLWPGAIWANVPTVPRGHLHDVTPPSISFAAPPQGASVRYLPWVGGQVQDNAGGSGLSHISFLLTRRTHGKTFYWGGYAWYPSLTTLRAVIQPKFFPENWAEFMHARIPGAGWSYPLLPNRHVQPGGNGAPQIGPSLFAGLYTLQVTAYDRAGNARRIRRQLRVVPDRTLPHVGFTWPRQGMRVSQFPTLGGWARDKGGSGLDRVEVVIWRTWPRRDWEMWTGRQWERLTSSSPTTLPAVLEKGRWRLNHNLPQGAALQPGTYLIWAAAYDKAGNRSGLRYFDYGIGPDGGHSSGVRNDYASITLHVR